MINGAPDKNPPWLNSGSAILNEFLTCYKFAIAFSFVMFVSDLNLPGKVFISQPGTYL